MEGEDTEAMPFAPGASSLRLCHICRVLTYICLCPHPHLHLRNLGQGGTGHPGVGDCASGGCSDVSMQGPKPTAEQPNPQGPGGLRSRHRSPLVMLPGLVIAESRECHTAVD